MDDIIIDDMEEGKALPTNQNNKLNSAHNASNVVPHVQLFEKLLSEITPIDFHLEAQLNEGEPIKDKHIVVVAVDKIIEAAINHNWGLMVKNSQVSIYNGAYWLQLEEEHVMHFLLKSIEKLGHRPVDSKYHRFVKDLYSQFLVSSYMPAPEKECNEVLINFKNGTLIIDGNGAVFFREFRKEDYLFYQLGFNFDPQAQAPKFSKYLIRVLTEYEERKILAEYCGYTFLKNSTLKLEKALILYGNGSNGKSAFFEILTAMLGPDNVTSYSLQSLTNENGYTRAKIQNKLLNYASEISVKMDSVNFKALASGEPIEARLPYGEPFMLKNYARLIFNTNELPREIEHNDAFFRRFLILHFDQKITDSEKDPQLSYKIIENELPGVFNWVIEGLYRLIKQKNFTKSEKAEKTSIAYQQQSDSVFSFLDDMGYAKGDINKMPLQSMYSEYKTYCDSYGYRACALKSLSERLRRHGYDVIRYAKGHVVHYKKL